MWILKICCTHIEIQNSKSKISLSTEKSSIFSEYSKLYAFVYTACEGINITSLIITTNEMDIVENDVICTLKKEYAPVTNFDVVGFSYKTNTFTHLRIKNNGEVVIFGKTKGVRDRIYLSVIYLSKS